MVEKGETSEQMGKNQYTKDGVTYFNFHVDNHETFQLACKNIQFRNGFLSARKPEEKKETNKIETKQSHFVAKFIIVVLMVSS